MPETSDVRIFRMSLPAGRSARPSTEIEKGDQRIPSWTEKPTATAGATPKAIPVPRPARSLGQGAGGGLGGGVSATTTGGGAGGGSWGSGSAARAAAGAKKRKDIVRIGAVRIAGRWTLSRFDRGSSEVRSGFVWSEKEPSCHPPSITAPKNAPVEPTTPDDADAKAAFTAVEPAALALAKDKILDPNTTVDAAIIAALAVGRKANAAPRRA